MPVCPGGESQLMKVIQLKEKTDTDILWVKEVVEATGSLDMSWALADWHFKEAVRIVDLLGEAKNPLLVRGLKEYVSKLIYRDF
jgi:hypothetical protein